MIGIQKLDLCATVSMNGTKTKKKGISLNSWKNLLNSVADVVSILLKNTVAVVVYLRGENVEK